MQRIPTLALVCAALLPAVARAETAMTAGPSVAAGKNVLWNGSFDGASLRPWSVGLRFAASRALRRHEPRALPADRPTPGPDRRTSSSGSARWRSRAGTTISCACGRTRRRDAPAGALRQDRRALHGVWAATADAGPRRATYAATFDARPTRTTSSWPSSSAAAGRRRAADRLPRRRRAQRPAVRDPARAAAPAPSPRCASTRSAICRACRRSRPLPAAGDAPLDWQLLDAPGRCVASGTDAARSARMPPPGERVQQIDFSSVTAAGRGLPAARGDDESVALRHRPDIYHRLKYDALAFFYLQRSGIPIEMPYAGSAAYVRPPGHPGDKSVACAPEAPVPLPLDVSGGWYDAGDHGKYVVNSGFAVWMLQNQYETLSRFGATARDFADGTMNIPERKNGRPDLLDEARFKLEFMLRMQVPAGQPLAGMAHHKVHDNAGRRSRRCPTGHDAALPAAAHDRRDAEPRGGGRAGGAHLADARSRVRGALPDRRRDRVRRGASEPAHDVRARDAGRRHLRRRRSRRRALLGRRRALHHHRQAGLQGELDRSRFASNGGSDAAALTELQLDELGPRRGAGHAEPARGAERAARGRGRRRCAAGSPAADRLRAFIDQRGYRMPLPRIGSTSGARTSACSTPGSSSPWTST